MKATLWLTKNPKEGKKQFRAAVFNVLSHNRDDHAKNFSFLMDEKGIWKVSPAYDLTFSSGPSGEHYSMIMRECTKRFANHRASAKSGCKMEKFGEEHWRKFYFSQHDSSIS